MTAPHRPSGFAQAVDLALVLIILASLAVAAVEARRAVLRRRARRRAWLRDFGAEARERKNAARRSK